MISRSDDPYAERMQLAEPHLAQQQIQSQPQIIWGRGSKRGCWYHAATLHHLVSQQALSTPLVSTAQPAAMATSMSRIAAVTQTATKGASDQCDASIACSTHWQLQLAYTVGLHRYTTAFLSRHPFTPPPPLRRPHLAAPCYCMSQQVDIAGPFHLLWDLPPSDTRAQAPAQRTQLHTAIVSAGVSIRQQACQCQHSNLCVCLQRVRVDSPPHPFLPPPPLAGSQYTVPSYWMPK